MCILNLELKGLNRNRRLTGAFGVSVVDVVWDASAFGMAAYSVVIAVIGQLGTREVIK